MTAKRFIRRVPKRPLRRWSAAKDRLRPPSTSFMHRVAVRPTRFRLVPGPDIEPAWDGYIGGAPMRRAFYVGRVTEIDVNAKALLVELWEVPSGRAMISWLPLDERIRGEPPTVGSQIRLWTWVELPGQGEVIHRYHGDVSQRKLTHEDRVELQKLLDAMMSQMREDET